jgi:hypothetical protein
MAVTVAHPLSAVPSASLIAMGPDLLETFPNILMTRETSRNFGLSCVAGIRPSGGESNRDEMLLARQGVGHPCSIISRIAASSLMVFSMNAIFWMFVRPPQLLKNGAFDGEGITHFSVFQTPIRDQEVGGSNPLAPTNFQPNQTVTATSYWQ